MKIIIEDPNSGKRFMIKGHDVEYMIYQQAEGKMVDGVMMTKNGKVMKNEWTFTGHYPTSLPSAVARCVNWCLADEDDDGEMVAEAIEAGKLVADKIDKRVRQMIAKVQKEAM